MLILLQLQKLLGKGDGGWGKKGLCIFFLADQKIASLWKKMRFGAFYSMSNKLLLVARHVLFCILICCFLPIIPTCVCVCACVFVHVCVMNIIILPSL